MIFFNVSFLMDRFRESLSVFIGLINVQIRNKDMTPGEIIESF
jgi:hypothetical protein